MHLHRLTFQAVGPFAGEHTIEFAELGASGLFLLEGPTGAGKSTIIDAVVFALYGKVASEQTSDSRLRSGHVAPNVETFVDLVLETGSGVYRVRRTPAYERPKKTGTGTTKQQASVRLWRLASPDASDGELLSTRLDEAGAELSRIVGLDRAQFVQTVVLPQGEFAGFLRAAPEDRRGLLQRVFGTELYEQVQARLEKMRAEAGREVEAAGDAVREATARFCGALHLDPEVSGELQVLAGELSEVEGPDGLLARAEAHVVDVERAATEARAAADASGTACRTARAALDEAQRLGALLDRRAHLRAERDALAEQAPQHAERVAALERARAAAAVVAQLDRLDEMAEAASRAEQAQAQACEEAPEDLRAAALSLADVDALDGTLAARLSAARDECTERLATLRRVLGLETRLPARRLAADEVAETLAQLRLDLQEAQARVAERPQVRAAIEERLVEARAAANGLAVAERLEVEARARLEAAESAVDLTLRVDRARVAVAEAGLAAAAAVERESETRRARIAGISGELAAQLQVGEACAVCGSTEHPRPAERTPDHVTPEQVDAAEVARRAAEDAHEAAGRRLSALETELGVALAGAAGAGVEEAKQALLVAQDGCATARSAGSRVQDLMQQLSAADLATVAVEQAARTAAEAVVRTEAELRGLRTAIAADEEEVADARQGFASVADCVADLQDRSERIASWISAQARREEAVARLAEWQRHAREALTASGLGDAAAARAAFLDPAALRALETRVERYRTAEAQVAAALAAPELVALAEDVVVDVEGARAAHDEADALATRDRDEAARLRSLHTQGASALTGLRAAIEGSAVVRAQAAPVVRMANLASGSSADNTRRLTLASYVLTRRFEDVVAAANDRLVAMSSGRFELVRSEEKEEVRGRRTGLAMKVLDHETEAERDPRTLSGGETFYVSLCLALGLADVVTAEAGGTDLGTLFIDEGFGSLDPETLDQVLAELSRLRDGGRVVGVVSHVEALKQTIAERIEVRRLPDGGSTLAVRA